VAACRGLPHNILDTKLDKACKIGIVEIEYWLIELGGRAENPTQDFLQLCVGDCLRKQFNQGIAYFSAVLIQSAFFFLAPLFSRAAACLSAVFLSEPITPFLTVARFLSRMLIARGTAVQFSFFLYTGWPGKSLSVHRLAVYERPIYIFTQCSCKYFRQPWHAMQ
jgi:hypothetical protein